MKTYILNPDNGKPVSIEDWKKDQNPTRANFVLVTLRDGKTRIIPKNHSDREMTFQQAEKYTANFQLDGQTGFRSPTRHEFIDLYDAKYTAGLQEALDLVGGNYMKGWMWTCERDADPRCSTGYAWLFNGGSGLLSYGSFCSSVIAAPLALFELGTSE